MITQLRAAHLRPRPRCCQTINQNRGMSRKRRQTGRKPSSSSPPLPDVGGWQPRTDASEGLIQSFRRRCLYADRRLRLRVAEERAANLDNFDSGLGVEEVFRDELQELLPRRYKVMTGVVTDRRGHTAGHCDAVIFNDTWFPAIKAPAIEGSRRPYLPIEGVYSIIEVKQALDEATLDRAMEKLVVSNRLYRPAVPRDRITENRETGSCTHYTSNPLYTAIFAIDLGRRADFQKLILRFFNINKLLKRREMVRSLVVLSQGCVFWGFHDGTNVRPAMFAGKDLAIPLFPVLIRSASDDTALYPFVQNLSSHLYHSVLGAEDIVAHYGEKAPEQRRFSTPSQGFRVFPDEELLASFENRCAHDSSDYSHPHVHELRE